MSERGPEDVIERALVHIRRDQQSRQLHRHRAAAQGLALTASSASAARFRYLDALEDAESGLAISAVGQAIGVDRPRASRLTTALLADGLIERRPAPDDSRYVLVRLTERGKTLLEAAHSTRRSAVAEALAGFTPDEARAFADLLERFVSAWPRQVPETD